MYLSYFAVGTKDNSGNPYYRCSNILFTLCNGIDRRTLDYDERNLKGDVNVLLLDKTGTITLGNRQVAEFLPDSGQSHGDLMEAALLSSFSDDTPESKSVIVLIQEKTEKASVSLDNVTFIPFSTATRMSGAQCSKLTYLKGAYDAITKTVLERGGSIPSDVKRKVNGVVSVGSTPLVHRFQINAILDCNSTRHFIHFFHFISPRK